MYNTSPSCEWPGSERALLWASQNGKRRNRHILHTLFVSSYLQNWLFDDSFYSLQRYVLTSKEYKTWNANIAACVFLLSSLHFFFFVECVVAPATPVGRSPVDHYVCINGPKPLYPYCCVAGTIKQVENFFSAIYSLKSWWTLMQFWGHHELLIPWASFDREPFLSRLYNKLTGIAIWWPNDTQQHISIQFYVASHHRLAITFSSTFFLFFLPNFFLVYKKVKTTCTYAGSGQCSHYRISCTVPGQELAHTSQ
jgi:hypothetical protein